MTDLIKTAKELIEKAEKATPGPYFNGYWSGQCHMKHAHGSGQCKYEYKKVIDADFAASYVCAAEENKELVGGDDWGSILSLNDGRYFAAADPTTITALCRLLLEYHEAIKYYENCQLVVRETGAIVQQKNGHGEWLNTVPIYQGETWRLGWRATEALAAAGKGGK